MNTDTRDQTEPYRTIDRLQAEVEKLKERIANLEAERNGVWQQWSRAREENRQLHGLVDAAIALFDIYSESFGLSDADFPGKNHQERACEFEDKFKDWVCSVRGHEFGADQCGKPEHDFCYRCGILKSEFERAT